MFVQQQTGSELLGGLAFTISSFTLHLGRSELFTENFLLPVTMVIAGGFLVATLIPVRVGSCHNSSPATCLGRPRLG